MNYRLDANPLENNGTCNSELQEEAGDSIPISIN